LARRFSVSFMAGRMARAAHRPPISGFAGTYAEARARGTAARARTPMPSRICSGVSRV